MNLRSTLLLAAFVLSSLPLTHAAELAGRWTAEFDTQIGVQKYVYEFQVDADKITGKAAYDHSMAKGEVELTAIKLSGDDIAFAETQKIDGNDLAITYSGKIAGDEMKLTRQVGDFATEQLVAKRARPAAGKPAEKK